jgi:hypothetical protein
LDVIKDYFGDAKWIGEADQKKLIVPILDRSKLEFVKLLFMLSMTSYVAYAMEPAPLGSLEHLFNLNPLTKLRCNQQSNVALANHFEEYVKLAEIVMV